jgi:hypothetical protein
MRTGLHELSGGQRQGALKNRGTPARAHLDSDDCAARSVEEGALSCVRQRSRRAPSPCRFIAAQVRAQAWCRCRSPAASCRIDARSRCRCPCSRALRRTQAAREDVLSGAAWDRPNH